jgi:hypothetical protein
LSIEITILNIRLGNFNLFTLLWKSSLSASIATILEEVPVHIDNIYQICRSNIKGQESLNGPFPPFIDGQYPPKLRVAQIWKYILQHLIRKIFHVVSFIHSIALGVSKCFGNFCTLTEMYLLKVHIFLFFQEWTACYICYLKALKSKKQTKFYFGNSQYSIMNSLQ